MPPPVAPTAEFIYAVLWLGTPINEGATMPVGTGVVVHWNGEEYLATALHVAKECRFQPHIRRAGHWWSPQWTTVGIDQTTDLAVLKTAMAKLSNLTPRYGTEGVILGAIGRAMGFPAFGSARDIDHIAEIEGHPVPLTVLVSAYLNLPDDPARPIHFTGGYINAGFSGGAMVFPANDGWTIAGIITHRAGLWRPVFRRKEETGEYIEDPALFVSEPSGMIRFTDFSEVERLIAQCLDVQ